jgi:hypothetical protein
MEILMWTALVGGGAGVALRFAPEILAGLFDRVERMRVQGARRDRLSEVPAHTIERLSLKRRKR